MWITFLEKKGIKVQDIFILNFNLFSQIFADFLKINTTNSQTFCKKHFILYKGEKGVMNYDQERTAQNQSASPVCYRKVPRKPLLS